MGRRVICLILRGFVGAVKAFDHLLERAEFFGNFVIIGETDYLCDVECKGIFKSLGKLHRC